MSRAPRCASDRTPRVLRLQAMTPGSNSDLAVLIGRFQPFHLGHLALLEHALAVAPRAVVVVGSARSPRLVKNPFTEAERIAVLRESLTPEQQAKVSFIPVRDYYDEPRWARAVKAAVARESQGKITLVGFRKDDSSSYLSAFPEWTELQLPRQADIDATSLRKLYFACESSTLPPELAAAVPAPVARFLTAFRASPEFEHLRAEMAALEEGRNKYGTGPFVTVDAVVTVGERLLLVQRGRAPGKGLWALPGGFLDGQERLVDAAIRELREETQVSCSDAELRAALRGVAVFDHPGRSQRGRTITHAHYFALPQTSVALPEVQGADDAQAARWVELSELPGLLSQLFDDHFQIIDHFLNIAAD